MLQNLINHYSNGNKTKFASLLGVKPQTINSWITRETFDSELIYSKCENVSARWLISGEGNMLYASSSESSITQNEDARDITPAVAIKTKPRIPFYAVAGTLTSALNGVTANECEFLPVIPTLPYYDFTIPVRGDSMYPDFCSGDEVACRLIDDPSFLQWGRTHVLDTSQGVVIKRIYPNNNSIICKSTNPQYNDFNIPKEEIYRMAIVVGIVRQY